MTFITYQCKYSSYQLSRMHLVLKHFKEEKLQRKEQMYNVFIFLFKW